MKLLRYVFAVVIIISSSAYVGARLYEYTKKPCTEVIKYATGRFDTEFGLSKEEFRKYLRESHEVWNRALEREIFVYKEGADFKVNLIFDQRQLDTVQKQRTEFGLTQVEKRLRELDEDLKSANQNHNAKVSKYEQEVLIFQDRKTQYERDVTYWNTRGGAPDNEYRKLQNELKFLEEEARRLNNETMLINNLTSEINRLVEIRNNAAEDFNRVANLYNEKYGKSVEFHQAEYTGKNINIYQFSEKTDLKLAMIHEFGHALGLDHIDVPGAVMYYLAKGDSETRLQLTEADLAELRRVCEIQ